MHNNYLYALRYQTKPERKEVLLINEHQLKEMEEELDRLRNVDVRTVDPETLVDIDGVIIRDDLPTEERIMDFVQQIGNPYCFRYNGIVVKVSFSGRKSLEACIRDTIEI